MSAGHAHIRPNEKHAAHLARLMANANLKALMAAHPRVDRSYDLPFLSGYSNNGRTIYVDRHFPQTVRVADRELDVTPFLIAHEHLEKSIMDCIDHDYETAHAFATTLEYEGVRAAGLTPLQYEQAIKPYVKGNDFEKLQRIPPDLDLTPYQRDSDEDLLLHLRRFGHPAEAERWAGTMEDAKILLCFNCGMKNRVLSGKSGNSKCDRCGSILPKQQTAILEGSLWVWTHLDPSRIFTTLFFIAFFLVGGYALIPRYFVDRPTAALAPSHSRAAPPMAEIARDHSGSFSVAGYINGVRVKFMLDTGASSVVITKEVAKSAGIPLEALSYTVSVDTANGRASAAAVKLDRLTIGEITEHSVAALVAQTDHLGTSLLGMSFLNRLGSWEVRGDRLIMRGRL